MQAYGKQLELGNRRWHFYRGAALAAPFCFGLIFENLSHRDTEKIEVVRFTLWRIRMGQV
jgi:hypothetical protein